MHAHVEREVAVVTAACDAVIALGSVLAAAGDFLLDFSDTRRAASADADVARDEHLRRLVAAPGGDVALGNRALVLGTARVDIDTLAAHTELVGARDTVVAVDRLVVACSAVAPIVGARIIVLALADCAVQTTLDQVVIDSAFRRTAVQRVQVPIVDGHRNVFAVPVQVARVVRAEVGVVAGLFVGGEHAAALRIAEVVRAGVVVLTRFGRLVDVATAICQDLVGLWVWVARVHGARVVVIAECVVRVEHTLVLETETDGAGNLRHAVRVGLALGLDGLSDLGLLVGVLGLFRVLGRSGISIDRNRHVFRVAAGALLRARAACKGYRYRQIKKVGLHG